MHNVGQKLAKSERGDSRLFTADDVKIRITENVKGVYSCSWQPYQSYGASPAIWDHTVLSATRHR